jgi:WD40 repeat protein
MSKTVQQWQDSICHSIPPGRRQTAHFPCWHVGQENYSGGHLWASDSGDIHLAPKQYDMNSGEITQEYDQHLGPVNSITFVDENRRFVTTSDDKTIRAWDFDIPVVIKYIAEPHMHSMPAVTLHPSSASYSRFRILVLVDI